MLLVPTRDGATVAACDPECLAAAASLVDIRDVVAVDEPGMCCTCITCGLTVESPLCAHHRLEVSCSGASWLLTSQACDFINVLHDMVGPYRLTDADWEAVTGLAEQIWAGGVVAAVWVREQGGGRDA